MIRKSILALFALALAGTAYGQDIHNANSHGLEVKSITSQQGATAQTVKFFFRNDKDPNSEKRAFYTSGFFNVWVKGDTTAAGNAIGGTDSLRIVVYPLNFDGTLGDQDSTVISAAFNFTAETWHGPFTFNLDNVAGYAVKLSQVAGDTAAVDVAAYH